MNSYLILFIFIVIISISSPIVSHFINLKKTFEKKEIKKIIKLKNQYLVMSILLFVFSFILPFKIFIAYLLIKDENIRELFLYIIIILAVVSICSGFTFINFYIKAKSEVEYRKLKDKNKED